MTTIVTTGADAFNSLLKIKYGDLYEAIKEASVTLNAVKAKQTKSDGLKFLWPILIGRAGGTTTNYAEGGTLPQGVKPIMPQAEAYTTRLASVLRVSGDLIHKGGRGEAAIESELALLLQNLVENRARTINQQMIGMPVREIASGGVPTDPSVNGVLGRINGAPINVPATSIWTMAVDQPLGYENSQLGSTWYSKNFRVNDFLAYGSVSGTTFTPDGYFRVDAIDASTSTLTVTIISSTGNPANNDWLVPCSGASASINNYGKALSGLGILLNQAADSGGQPLKFQNVTVTPNNIRAYGTAKVKSSGTFVEADWHKLLASIRSAGQRTPKIAIMDETLRNLYMEVTKADVRQAPWKLAGGFTSIEFASESKVDLICEPEMPYGMAYFLDSESLRWMYLSKPQWESQGAVAGNHLRQIPGEDAFEAVYVERSQFGFDLLNTHGVYFGCTITDPTL